ncbi:MAG: transcription antitermination factor NusB [Clostridia bacterium]|nr:transcription antitermination factor NusB [Clostridia bacterium]
MSRKIAREVAFKVVFETAFQEDEKISKLMEELLQNSDEEYEITPEDDKYIEEITIGVKEKEAELDEKIKSHLKGWTMERLNKVDVAILRLAIYEILYREDIPYKVSVNEAVELAKVFSEDSSPSFINGVLAEIINDGGNK